MNTDRQKSNILHTFSTMQVTQITMFIGHDFF